ncbi:MAG: hypothetical protein ACK41U_14290 [Paracoccus sp. (in: a-proteobacteria)]|uniref:hypothetical protein n=1 Tax=Paracoccus sp. TaxID=267 RepID=UPI00391BB2BA
MEQNGAGTRNPLWHKSDTECSLEVLAPEKENPGALAGATGTEYQDWLSWIDHNLIRESAARALARAVADCDPADRVPFLEPILDGLRAGMPMPLFGQIMAEANFWAGEASRAELKAYCAACYARLAPEDQAAFRSFIDGRAAA